MNVECIVAMSKNGVIGNNNKIPWHIPEDLQYFKRITQNSVVIMGRKTFESLPKRPLPNRINIVLTNHEIVSYDENVIYTNMENIFQKLASYNKPIFVIGGAEIYKLFIHKCSKLYVTIVEDIYEGDSYFVYDENNIQNDFKIIESGDLLVSKINGLKYRHCVYSADLK
jgi:dihydrofolate reductase